MPIQHTPPPRVATSAGTPVANDQNSLVVGDRGPVLMQDWQLIEELVHQNRERIPERVDHAKGCGAHGVLKVTGDISNLTCARVLQPGAETPMIARFSTGPGELAAADHERDVRGFALKFYTEEGNWDLVGNNTPVFSIRDPLKLPGFIHAQKRHPCTHLRSATAMWDFWSQSPESLHQVTMLFSDRSLPVSPMHMNGYGGHAYSLWNEKGERVWVKFHFKTHQGHRHCTDAGVEDAVGRTRKGYQGALFSAIEAGAFPQWTVQVQIMTPAQAEMLPFNPFDLTKVWPHASFPPLEIGVLELDRNPDNYFAEIGQLAFSPSNVVRGIDHSPDRMLRLHAPADRFDHQDGTDDFSQPRALFLLFDQAQRARLFANIAAAMKGVPVGITERQIDLFRQVHPEFGEGVCAALDALDPQF